MIKTPTIDASAFVAPNATVLGDVTIGARSSVFFGAVIRTETVPITIGDDTNIQDNCIVHAYRGLPTIVGNGVTVGHGAILHSCIIGDNSLIGMGAILLNGSTVGRDCIVAAGALVPQNMVIPDGSLVMGNPAKIRRQLTGEEIAANRTSAGFYIAEASEYREYFEK